MKDLWKSCALAVAFFASSASMAQIAPKNSAINLLTPQGSGANALHAQLERCARLRAGDEQLKKQRAAYPNGGLEVVRDSRGRIDHVTYLGRTTRYEYESLSAQQPTTLVVEGQRIELPKNISSDQRRRAELQLKMRRMLFAQVRAQCGLAPVASLNGLPRKDGPNVSLAYVPGQDDLNPDFPPEYLTQEFWNDYWRTDVYNEWAYDAARGRPRQCQPIADCFTQCDTEAEENNIFFGAVWAGAAFIPGAAPFAGAMMAFSSFGIYMAKKECKEVLCRQPCPN